MPRLRAAAKQRCPSAARCSFTVESEEGSPLKTCGKTSASHSRFRKTHLHPRGATWEVALSSCENATASACEAQQREPESEAPAGRFLAAPAGESQTAPPGRELDSSIHVKSAHPSG